jgi:hypothetical protein
MEQYDALRSLDGAERQEQENNDSRLHKARATLNAASPAQLVRAYRHIFNDQ